MALTPEQLDEFTQATLDLFKRRKWTDISISHQYHIACSRLLKSKKVMERGGAQLSFRVQVGTSGTAREAELFDEDQTNIDDTLKTATVPWRAQTANFSWDIYEDEFQSDRETIIEELKLREHQAYVDLCELFEAHFWQSPSSTTSKKPNGLPYWVVKNASEGFNGGNPTGHSDGAGGLSSTTYPNWSNWTNTYTTVAKSDLVRKVRKAMRRCRFKTPHPFAEHKYGELNWELFTTDTVTEKLEELAEEQNESLGNDLASKDGKVTIGGTPVMWVPYISADGDGEDSQNPVYGVDWSTFRPFCKKGAYMRKSKQIRAPHQRNVRTVHIDNWMNYMCTNRRCNFVIYDNS